MSNDPTIFRGTAASTIFIFTTSMSKKKFVLRIDEDLYEAVEKWAADEFRSVNGQLEWIIYQKIKEARRLKKKEQTPPSGEE